MTGWSGRLSLSSFRGRQMRSRLQLDIRNLSLGRRHLVNAYEVKAGIGVKVIAGNTVWSMPKRLRGFTTRRYINPLYLYVTLPYRSATLGYSRYKMPIRPQFALVDPWPRSIDTNRRWRSTWKCTWRDDIIMTYMTLIDQLPPHSPTVTILRRCGPLIVRPAYLYYCLAYWLVGVVWFWSIFGCVVYNVLLLFPESSSTLR